MSTLFNIVIFICLMFILVFAAVLVMNSKDKNAKDEKEDEFTGEVVTEEPVCNAYDYEKYMNIWYLGVITDEGKFRYVQIMRTDTFAPKVGDYGSFNTRGGRLVFFMPKDKEEKKES